MNVRAERAARAARLLRSTGARHGAVLGAAMLIAGVLDYAVSVLAGRWLGPTEFGVFVSITALLQVLLSVATAIRLVVALQAAGITARPRHGAALGSFLRGVRRWSWRRGIAATLLAALASPLLVRPLRLPTAWPLWAASAMVLMLFLREATLGALQGVQDFPRLALAQVGQAALRLALAAGLLLLGARATGAILAQPLAAIGAVAIGAQGLRPRMAAPGDAPPVAVNRSQVASTVLGLAVLGVLTNLDALVVKAAFAPRVAGDYGAVVTFERISFFLPCSLSFLLLPKATQRIATGRDPRPILLLALAGSLAPGIALSAAYLAAPGVLVRHVFTAAYADPGLVLGLASLAATLYAGVNLWLNYALSVARPRFMYALLGVVAAQGAAMLLVAGRGLTALVGAMVAGGLLGNVAGWVTTWSPRVAPQRGLEARGALQQEG